MSLLLSALFIFPSAHAWDNHQIIMEKMLNGAAASSRSYLNQKIKVPCIEDEEKELKRLSGELQIIAAKVPRFSTLPCGKKNNGIETALKALVTSNFVDEPDFGMDQNLPESADPHRARPWMGGSTGPTSQGFRHMIFPGFKWSEPLASFQIPTHSVGEALERIAKLRAISNRYAKEKNTFWAIRTLMWELHYVEDLHQPFHSTQIPSLKMIPWKKLFHRFVAQSTHAMSNYHYAYEGLTLEMLREGSEGSLQECLQGAGEKPFQDPRELIGIPHSRAQELGTRLVEVFGDYPKLESVILPEGIGQIDYFSLLRGKPLNLSPEEEASLSGEERMKNRESTQAVLAVAGLKEISCSLMKTMTTYVWSELDSFSNSIKTGK